MKLWERRSTFTLQGLTGFSKDFKLDTLTKSGAIFQGGAKHLKPLSYESTKI